MRAFGLWVLLAAAASPGLRGQDSQFGLRGLGHPGRPWSARALGTAGAFAPFDVTSARNPATTALVQRLTAYGSLRASSRHLDAEGVDVTLRTTRFPSGGLLGRFFADSRFAIRYGTYLDRSFRVTTADTVAVRGASVAVSDAVSSDGAVTDLTFGLAKSLSGAVEVGVAFHRLIGSAQVEVEREFGDSLYRTLAEGGTLTYEGIGVSVGATFIPTGGIAFALYGRSDRRLNTSRDDQTVDRANLPNGIGGGILLRVTDQLHLAASGEWQSWSDAGPDLDANETMAFDTYAVGFGAELGRPGRILRLGVRYAQLPFGPIVQPTELDFTAGLGLGVSGGRGNLDFAIERATRRGSVLDEQLWTVQVGLTIRP